MKIKNNYTKTSFKKKFLFFSKKLDIDFKKLSFRKMNRKWASVSTSGNFSFNVDLLKKEKKLCNYVMVHELLHVKIPNHGKLWKAIMNSIFKNYKKLELKLNS
jgi:predicted metal-dependent hydrolase